MRRAEAIIDELTATLDHERGGVIASRLQGIYAFSRRHLLEAWRETDPDKIDEVAGLLAGCRHDRERPSKRLIQPTKKYWRWLPKGTRPMLTKR